MEILNMEWHRTQLMVKALNKLPTVEKAAVALGISVRNLHLNIRVYEIEWRKKEKKYVLGRIPQYQILEPSEEMHLQNN